MPDKSNREIGRLAGADHHTVDSVRLELEAGGEIPHLNDRTGADGKAYPATRPQVRKITHLPPSPRFRTIGVGNPTPPNDGKIGLVMRCLILDTCKTYQVSQVGHLPPSPPTGTSKNHVLKIQHLPPSLARMARCGRFTKR